MMASIQYKITAACIGIFFIAGGAAGVGIWSTSTMNADANDIARSGQILRNHMQADMMHDALRADVLAALHASNPAAGIKFDQVKADLAEHVDSFRSMIAENKALAKDPVTQKALADVEPPLVAYIDSATNLVSAAETNPTNAMNALPDFMTQFSTLESAMEHAGDQIETVTASISDRSTQAAGVIQHTLKAILGLTLILSIALFVFFRRSVTAPILKLSSCMVSIADGNTDVNCVGLGRK